MRIGEYQSIPYEQAMVTPRMKLKPEGEDFSAILGKTDTWEKTDPEVEEVKVSSSSSNIQVKDRLRMGYWTPEDKDGRRDWIAEQEEVDKYAGYYEGHQSPLGILKRLEMTGTEVKSNDSSSIWEELREQYDVRNVTFYELCDIANKLYDAGEMSSFEMCRLTFDMDEERAWRDHMERCIEEGFSVEEFLSRGVTIEEIVNSGVSTEKLVNWGIGIEEIEKFKKTEKPKTESISQLYLSWVLGLDKDEDKDKSLQELFKYDEFLTPADKDSQQEWTA